MYWTMITLLMYSDKCRTHSRVSIQFDYLVYLLSNPELNNCCVKEDIIIISGHIT